MLDTRLGREAFCKTMNDLNRIRKGHKGHIVKEFLDQFDLTLDQACSILNFSREPLEAMYKSAKLEPPLRLLFNMSKYIALQARKHKPVKREPKLPRESLDFGSWLIKKLISEGWTGEKIAKILKVNGKTVSDIKNKKCHMLTAYYEILSQLTVIGK